MVRRAFIIFAVILLLGAAAAVIAPFVLPADTVKRQVETLIEQNTGWRVALTGDVSISVFPSIALQAEEVSVSPPNHEPILSTEFARFSIGLASLFSGKISINEIIFDRPDLTLISDENGAFSWAEPKDATDGLVTAPSNLPVPVEESLVSKLVNGLSISKLAINEATITFGKDGEPANSIDNLTLAASLPDPDGALKIDGKAVIMGEAITLKGDLPALKNLLSTQSGRFSLAATYKSLVVNGEGDVALNADTLFAGTLSAQTDRLTDLVGTGTFKENSVRMGGTVTVTKDKLTVSLKDSRVADVLFFANIAVDTKAPRPLITGVIDLGAVNLDKLLLDKSGKTPAASTAETDKTTIGIDLSPLHGIDANIKFASGSIVTGDYKLEDLQGDVVLRAGKLDFNIRDVRTVAGSASMSLQADTKKTPLTTFGALKAERLSIQTLMAVAGVANRSPSVDGLIGTDLQFAFQGLTPENIMATVNARGQVRVFDTTFKNLGLSASLSDPDADTVRNFDLTADINGIANPVKWKGSALWRGDKVDISGFATPSKLLNGRETPTKLILATEKALLQFKGSLKNNAPIKGQFLVKTPSLRRFAKWLNTDLPPGKAYGKLNAAGTIAVAATALSVSDLNIELDDIKARGKVDVGLKGKPNVVADLAFDTLNVDPYIGTTANPAAKTSAPTKSSEWDRTPLDFSFLDLADITMNAKVQSLNIQGMRVGPLTLNTDIKNGALVAALNDVRFYEGRAQSTITLNKNGALPKLDISLETSAVKALPFLTDAAKFQTIEGLLDLKTNLTAQGRSQAEMIANLNGTAAFAFKNGALRGINIARSLRALTSGSLSGWNKAATEKTDFSAFDATFDIKQGVASNEDLKLIGPLVRVTGRGIAPITEQRLSYRVDPKIVATLKGQGDDRNLTGLAVPIIIKGPWANPKIYPDIKGFLENPAAGLKTLQSLGGGFAKLAKSKPGELISSLTTNKDSAVGGIKNAIEKNTGLSTENLIKDGKIDKNAALDAVTNILGKKQPAAAKPLSPGDIPVPRPRPGQNKPADVAKNVVQNLLKKPKPTQPANNNQAQKPKEDVGQLIQGIGSFLKKQ